MTLVFSLPVTTIDIDHNAPAYTEERTCYFDGKMDQFAQEGGRHLVFTPPSTRGSLLTRCEAWSLNVQRSCVPTLVDGGHWPVVEHRDHPSVLSLDQADWLSRRWGECAHLWARKGWRPEQYARDRALIERHPTTRYDIDRALYASAIEDAARQERERDLGPMDSERRPLGMPGWPASPPWHETSTELRVLYLQRVTRIIRAVRMSILPAITGGGHG